jgi:hypothetical protein
MSFIDRLELSYEFKVNKTLPIEEDDELFVMLGSWMLAVSVFVSH